VVPGAEKYTDFLKRAFGAVCEIAMPLADRFWVYGQLKGPFGFRWAIVTRKEEPTTE
jgi:uncharacterized glyoxalase superfamily protein PhnB